jgi:hypothetical protein
MSRIHTDEEWAMFFKGYMCAWVCILVAIYLDGC